MPDRETLAAQNAPELAKMNRDAAGIVHGLFIECANAGTLIRFSNAVQGGTQVDAEVVSGDLAIMTRKARLLQITINGSTLQV